MFKIRTTVDFKDKVPKIETDIAKYEDFVNLSYSIEAASEARPQFFFQAVYFLPKLILLNICLSYRMLSIVFSFTSLAVSNYFIR